MERGYLKLWRRTIDSPVFSDPNLWHMASWCLLRAGHKKRAFRFKAGNQFVVVPLESGQFATGRNSGADELGIKPSTFYKRLKRLASEPYNFITVTPHSSTLCTVVTICNWQYYQAVDIIKEQPEVTSEEQAGSKRVASGEQAGNTNKNVENVQNVSTQESAGFPEEFKDFLQDKTAGTWVNDLQKWRGEYAKLASQVNEDLPAVFKWAKDNYRATVGDARWFVSSTWPKIWAAYGNKNTASGKYAHLSPKNRREMEQLDKEDGI